MLKKKGGMPWFNTKTVAAIIVFIIILFYVIPAFGSIKENFFDIILGDLVLRLVPPNKQELFLIFLFKSF